MGDDDIGDGLMTAAVILPSSKGRRHYWDAPERGGWWETQFSAEPLSLKELGCSSLAVQRADGQQWGSCLSLFSTCQF